MFFVDDDWGSCSRKKLTAEVFKQQFWPVIIVEVQELRQNIQGQKLMPNIRKLIWIHTKPVKDVSKFVQSTPGFAHISLSRLSTAFLNNQKETFYHKYHMESSVLVSTVFYMHCLGKRSKNILHWSRLPFWEIYRLQKSTCIKIELQVFGVIVKHWRDGKVCKGE